MKTHVWAHMRPPPDTISKIEISPKAILDIVLSKERITKVLSSLSTFLFTNQFLFLLKMRFIHDCILR